MGVRLGLGCQWQFWGPVTLDSGQVTWGWPPLWPTPGPQAQQHISSELDTSTSAHRALLPPCGHQQYCSPWSAGGSSHPLAGTGGAGGVRGRRAEGEADGMDSITCGVGGSGSACGPGLGPVSGQFWDRASPPTLSGQWPWGPYREGHASAGTGVSAALSTPGPAQPEVGGLRGPLCSLARWVLCPSLHFGGTRPKACPRGPD